MSDIIDGRVSDTEKYVRKALAGSAVGFLSGATGLLMQGAGLGKTLALGYSEGFLGSALTQGLLNDDGEINWVVAIGEGAFSAVMDGWVWTNANEEIKGITEETQKIMDGWDEKDMQAFYKLSKNEKEIYLEVISREGDITESVKQIVENNNGYLGGLEYRIKSPSSVYEKIHLRPESTSISKMNDIIRYTEIQGPDKLVISVEGTIKDLESEGYGVLKLKNTWMDVYNPYNGINAQITAPNNQIFELQFHTPESFELENGALHELYEQKRCANDRDCIMRINEKMFELSVGLERPVGIQNIVNINH